MAYAEGDNVRILESGAVGVITSGPSMDKVSIQRREADMFFRRGMDGYAVTFPPVNGAESIIRTYMPWEMKQA